MTSSLEQTPLLTVQLQDAPPSPSSSLSSSSSSSSAVHAVAEDALASGSAALQTETVDSIPVVSDVDVDETDETAEASETTKGKVSEWHDRAVAWLGGIIGKRFAEIFLRALYACWIPVCYFFLPHRAIITAAAITGYLVANALWGKSGNILFSKGVKQILLDGFAMSFGIEGIALATKYIFSRDVLQLGGSIVAFAFSAGTYLLARFCLDRPGSSSKTEGEEHFEIQEDNADPVDGDQDLEETSAEEKDQEGKVAVSHVAHEGDDLSEVAVADATGAIEVKEAGDPDDDDAVLLLQATRKSPRLDKKAAVEYPKESSPHHKTRRHKRKKQPTPTAVAE